MMLAHDAVLAAANQDGSRDAVRWLAQGEAVSERLTYTVLAERTLDLAMRLAGRGLCGRPVALVLDPGPEVVVSVLACFAAGAIVAPLPSPRGQAAAERLASSMADLRPDAVLTTAELAALPQVAGPGVAVVDVRDASGRRGKPRRPVESDLAVVQYSSGSTAEPRGIALTHCNIAANLAMMRIAMEGNAGDVSVGWLPHSHDMGLFGTILAPLWHHATAVLMPPVAFLRRPMRWIRAISAHRASHTVAPDFGYALAARRASPEEVAGVDLRNWRIACIGAEPTQPATLEAMVRVFGPAGFTADVFRSCYGLAEATLLCASGPARVTGARVACGPPVSGGRLRLRRVPEATGDAGEILVAGPHVSPGLWSPGSPGRLRVYPNSLEADGARWVATGDLGRFADGDLVVIDRLKDLLPMRGGTLGPAEVEMAAMAADSRIDAAAAVPDDRPGGNGVRLALEADDRRLPGAEREAVGRHVADTLAARFGIWPRIVFVPPRSLPRTTSGKIRRFAVRTLPVWGDTADA